MRKALAILVLTGAVLLSGCGSASPRIAHVPIQTPRTTVVVPPLYTVSPADSPCAAYIERIPYAAYQWAGAPVIACEDHAGPNGASGWHDTNLTVSRTTIHVDATNTHGLPAEVYFPAVLAHELGHSGVWFHAVSLAGKYAAIRGFTPPHITGDVMAGIGAYLSVLNEDYAETFAFATGLWVDFGSPAPYAFHNEAGVPTPEQIAALREAGLLPR